LASWRLLGLTFGLLPPPGAPVFASWSLLGLLSGLLAPPGVHFWPPGACSGPFWTHVWLIVRAFRGTSLNFQSSSRKQCSKSLVKRSFENSRKHCSKHSSKGLSRPLQARDAEGHCSVAGLGASPRTTARSNDSVSCA